MNRTLPLVLLTMAGLAPALEAQVALPNGYRATAAAPHTHATAVGMAIRIPYGSAHDPDGREGTALLLARVREDQADRRLDPSRALLAATVTRDATVYTLVALPDAWSDAVREVDRLVFDAPVPEELLAARRAELLERLAFEAGSPVMDFRREASAMLATPQAAWARPPRGTAVSLAAVTQETLTAFRDGRYRRAAAVLAVVGALPAGLSVPDGTSPVRDSSSVPWRVGSRTALVQEVTSAWVAVAWPVPSSLPRTALELVAHMLREELDPVPPDPDRYSVDVRVDAAPGGTVLMVEASVLPEAASRWETKILDALRELAERRLDEDFFRWRRRRFRASRLLEEARPEVEAGRITEDLLRVGRARALDPLIWSLDTAALQAAAGALGEPRVLVFGPDLGDREGQTGRDP